ncbi:MAG: hypothetical protein ACOYKB_01890 [Succiniclasticum sp.]|jgi:Flp pilus assembly protein protease CpaA
MSESFFNNLLDPGPLGISNFAFLFSLILAYFVHNDARNHNVPHAGWWALGTFLVWIVFFPLYMVRHYWGRKRS